MSQTSVDASGSAAPGPAATGPADTGTFAAINPRTRQAGTQTFADATLAEVAAAAAAAAKAFPIWSRTPAVQRARFLRAAADALAAQRDAIVSTADAESGLGTPRLNGELDRTTGQLRMFAALLEEGSFVEATISPGDPAAQPLPRPEVRRMLVALGPVAVITPSNFPLAFGAAGGDTASALAAGCPVIVKGHASHPGTSELCAQALRAAAQETGAPEGVFTLLQARAIAVPSALTQAPEVQAVAFTGSPRAGRALCDLAAARPQPIPVYAEMGSANPLFVGAAALDARGPAIADGLAGSITLGTGQFCTKPGLVFVPDTAAGAAFARLLGERVAARDPGVMLNPGIHANLQAQIAQTAALPVVEALTPPPAESADSLACGGFVVSVTADDFLATHALWEEHFGPVAIIVRCAPERMPAIAARLEGTLTATLHADAADEAWAAALCDVLSDKAGRLVWNGYPTGVAVVQAMHHGGPYPSSSNPLHTSVGTAAIRRFLRPVAWQNVPDALLPEALRAANPLGIQRSIDGGWTRDPLAK